MCTKRMISSLSRAICWLELCTIRMISQKNLCHKQSVLFYDSIFISSPYLKEAYKFLEKVFDNLRTIQMRDELIKDVYFGAYQHIGFSFMEKIIDERIISVNMGALHQMSLGMVPKLPSVITDP